MVMNADKLNLVVDKYFGDIERIRDDILTSFEGKKVDCWISDEAVDLGQEKFSQLQQCCNSVTTELMYDVVGSEVAKNGAVQVNESDRVVRFQRQRDEYQQVATSINTQMYLFERNKKGFVGKVFDCDIGGHLFCKILENNISFCGVTPEFQWLDGGAHSELWTEGREPIHSEIAGPVSVDRNLQNQSSMECKAYPSLVNAA